MNLTVFFYASLREAIGVSRQALVVPQTTSTTFTSGQLREWLANQPEPYASAFAAEKALRCAVNQVVVKSDFVIKENDEIAFFPPVTGG